MYHASCNQVPLFGQGRRLPEVAATVPTVVLRLHARVGPAAHPAHCLPAAGAPEMPAHQGEALQPTHPLQKGEKEKSCIIIFLGSVTSFLDVGDKSHNIEKYINLINLAKEYYSYSSSTSRSTEISFSAVISDFPLLPPHAH